MDSTKNQVSALSDKVDNLYQMVEQLGIRVTEVLSEVRRTRGVSGESSSHRVFEERYPYQQNFSRSDNMMTHKDVLVDANYPETGSQSREKELSPEIQIQRLTAQLTAAYNRIAALEEQLLAKRVH